MIIEKIHIKGFRNYIDAEIKFQLKTLIIGANDVGKTNLLYALRLLFDKSISDNDLELSDSDYNAYSETDTIEITVTISSITEDCLLSVFGGAIKDGTTIIRYTNSKSGTYNIFNGFSESTLEEKNQRFYLRRLNMQYVDTNRDLFGFLRYERNNLLKIAKESLGKEETESDEKTIDALQLNLNTINEQIGSLNYISKSLDNVNNELGEISVHNLDQNVCFVAGESKVDRMLENLVLAYSNGNNPLSIGGDGRNNQIFLATWISKQHIQKSIDHISFYAIEEPEAHLHPHQQRKLASYIMEKFDSQVFITTHSPHIASKFNPECIVRLYSENKFSFAACCGCSLKIKKVIDEFSYRLNSLSAETFFSDGVFLVEGPSEVILYSALASELKLDLDRRNISILSVEGIGFKPYVAVCDALKIPWVLRTDNDIFTIPRSKPIKLHYAGISRVIGIADICCENTANLLTYWNDHSSENEWLKDDANPDNIPDTAKALNDNIKKQVKQYGIFLSEVDLENDFASSALSDDLKEYYGISDIKKLVKEMQKRKAENMLGFVTKKHNKLSLLKEDSICEPLNTLITKVEEKTRSK